MLKNLTVQNFAIVDDVQLEFDQGMSAITGETGAGKSIVAEALGVALGRRIQSHFPKENKKLSVTLEFDVGSNRAARSWLKSNDLDHGDECILRRTAEAAGRSRAYVNGTPVTLTQLKELGGLLVDIVGQHTSRLLLQPQQQLEALDLHCENRELTEKLRETWEKWTELTEKIESGRRSLQDSVKHLDLLRYQVKELEAFSPAPDEFEEIEKEHKRLSRIEALVDNAKQSRAVLQEQDDNVHSRIFQTIHRIEAFEDIDENLATAKSELEAAAQHIQNADDEIKSCLNNSGLSDEEFRNLEARLSGYFDLARKYRVPPAELAALYRNLDKELGETDNPQTNLEALEKTCSEYKQRYYDLAKQVNRQRCTAAAPLAKKITHLLHTMNMPEARFDVVVRRQESSARATGFDDVEFLVKTNSGQPPGAINAVASGGELSRIGLAIRVIFAKNHSVATLVFDEVDSGVGGKTAETIGRLLQKLGREVQVLCITHLPQIAVCAHQHYSVNKHSGKNHTSVTVSRLDDEERNLEIARMLSGSRITDRTLANAREMLKTSAS